MEHEMKLQPDYYNFILNGTKRIEIRLFDEKRQQIKIGDMIKFLKVPELNESFNAKVVGLLRYGTFEDMFKDENNRQPKYRNLISDKTYRGIIQLNDELLAFTSNAVLPGGENKLIIFDLSKNKIKEEIEGYSYIASSNGMSVIDKDDKKLLLCGCKKYTSKQKNGILFVILNTDEKGLSKPTFIETKEFEVYCFCPIKIDDSKAQREVNDKNDYSQGTDFFFAGGFDRKTREGKIKLFKLENNGTNNVEGIKFLQDIEIDKTEEILTTEEENQNKSKDIFNGFKGAISSMIQSTITQNILVSCYDGKIYLFTKPNLSLYVQNTKNNEY